jgi:hypothetical protein
MKHRIGLELGIILCVIGDVIIIAALIVHLCSK